MDPRIQYVRTPDGVAIAYTTYGQGGLPVVYLEPPHNSHLQREWEMPWNVHAHKLEQLAARGLVVRLDPRGSGLSDRGVSDQSLEARVSDLQAVVDRLGLERFAIYSIRNASLVALAFAARFPGRIARLALDDSFTCGMEFWNTDINRGLVALAEYTWDVFTEANARIAYGWDHRAETPQGNAGDLALQRAAFTRACVNQGDFLSWATAELAMDVSELLPSIAAPSMVLRYTSGSMRGHDQDASRRLAAGLPNCRFVIVPNPESYMEVLGNFLAEDPAALRPEQPAVPVGLRTILFTDIQDHTAMMTRLGDQRGREVLREHERLTREALATYEGSEIKAMGDGFLASFASTQRALECAIALQRALRDLSLPAGDDTRLHVRIGVNAGEPIAEEDDLFGSSVIAAARIAAAAEGGQVLVSDVVRQLAAGKGFLFSDRGEQLLRGFEEPMRLWELSTAE